MEERKIDLVDLMVEILYRWKYMILTALCGAMLLGGLSYYKSLSTVQRVDYTGMTPAQMKEYLEKSIFAFDRANVKQIVNVEKSIEKYEEYFNTSVLMKLDPNAVPQAGLVYSVTCKDKEEAEAVTALYIQMLRNGGLASRLGVSEELIRVLGAYDSYEIRLSKDNSGNLNGFVYSYTAAPSTVFTITLRNASAEAASSMADATEEYIKEITKDKAFAGRNFTCTKVSRTEEVVSDVELMECQKALHDAVYSNTNNNVASARDALKGSSLAYYNIMKELENGGSDTEEAEAAANYAAAAVSRPSVNKRYVVVGFAAGLFIYAGVLLIMYLLSPKIHYTDNLDELYGLSRIGSIPDEKKWNRSAYTKWLRKIRDRGNRFFARDKAVELTCTGIRALAGKKNLSSVCVIGCNMEGQTGEAVSSIINALSGSGLKAEAIANILYDADAYDKFCSYQGVVLLEKAGETMYEEIQNELRKISDQGMTLLGAVVVE